MKNKNKKIAYSFQPNPYTGYYITNAVLFELAQAKTKGIMIAILAKHGLEHLRG